MRKVILTLFAGVLPFGRQRATGKQTFQHHFARLRDQHAVGQYSSVR